MSRPWWRRNLVAVVAVPVLLALALAANGQRVVDYWWPGEPHHRVGSGGSVLLSATVKDANGSHPTAARVSLRDVEQVTALTPAYDGDTPPTLTIPAGVRLWRITLHVAADPDAVLSGCRVDVRDAAGRTYRLGVDRLTAEPVGDAFACVPPGDPGPPFALVKGPVEPQSGLDGDDDPRPAAWDWSGYVVMPAGRRPDRVRVWLQLPDYAELAVR